MGKRNRTRNPERAKALYLEYRCSEFELRDGGVMDEYKSYGATKAEEAAWRREYIAQQLEQLSTGDLRPLWNMGVGRGSLVAIEAIPDLIRLAWQGDSFAKLEYASTLWELTDYPWTPRAKREQAYAAVMLIWKSLLNEPIQLTPEHVLDIKAHLPMWGLPTPEAYIRGEGTRMLATARAWRHTFFLQLIGFWLLTGLLFIISPAIILFGFLFDRYLKKQREK